MTEVISIEQVDRLGSILSVWAHPDDESFFAAGLMAAAIRNGQTVVCVVMTRGEKGLRDEAKWPAASLGQVRSRELGAAMDILGVSECACFDLPDGGCHLLDPAAPVGQITALLERYRPDTVVTFPPDGVTGHPDHAAVSGWTAEVLKRYQAGAASLYYAVSLQEHYDRLMREADEKFDFYFNIDQPCLVEAADCDILLRLDPELARLKYAALSAMPSQTEAMLGEYGPRLAEVLSTEGFVRADRHITWGHPKDV